MSTSSVVRRSLRHHAGVASVSAATAVAAGLTLGTPQAHAAAPCDAVPTQVAPGIYEVRFTGDAVCDWTVPAAATQLEALLVGAGGPGSGLAYGYAGGGGEVLLVDLADASGTITVEVGQLPTVPPNTTVTVGAVVHTARAGLPAPGCGGDSGNENAGCPSLHGGGAGGAATEGAGGPGVVVDDIAGPLSLFDGVDDCYGGGGAAATMVKFTSDVYEELNSGTATCGGGYYSSTDSFPIDVVDATIVNNLPRANSGGGGSGANGYLSDIADGTAADGVVVIRYRGPVELPPTGSSDTTTTLAATLLAAGAALTVTASRRRRHA